MTGNMERITTTLPPPLAKRLEASAFARETKTQAEAIRALVRYALDAKDKEANNAETKQS